MKIFEGYQSCNKYALKWFVNTLIIALIEPFSHVIFYSLLYQGKYDLFTDKSNQA